MSDPITLIHLKVILGPSLSSIDGSQQRSSIKGRIVCLVHLIATPLKIISSIGHIAARILCAAYLFVQIVTLNTSPSLSKHIIFHLADAALGIATLPLAVIANIIRCLVGTTLYPAAMIRNDTGLIMEDKFDRWPADHMFLAGTLVNYGIEEPNI